jgi:hypothetical protein
VFAIAALAGIFFTSRLHSYMLKAKVPGAHAHGQWVVSLQ